MSGPPDARHCGLGSDVGQHHGIWHQSAPIADVGWAEDLGAGADPDVVADPGLPQTAGDESYAAVMYRRSSISAAIRPGYLATST